MNCSHNLIPVIVLLSACAVLVFFQLAVSISIMNFLELMDAIDGSINTQYTELISTHQYTEEEY